MSRDDATYDDSDLVELTDIERAGKLRRKGFVRRFIAMVGVLVSLLFLGLVGAAAAVLWVFWTYGKGLPDYHQLANYEPPVATRIHASNGALLAEHATEKRVFVPVEAMPPQLVHAFLSAEDKAFYSHFGIDPRSAGRFDITKLAAMLEDVHVRLAGVVIECLPYGAFIDRYDRPGTLFYLDPPYWGSENDYGRDLFSRQDFERLAEQLAGLRGRFILSLNDRPEVRETFGAFAMEAVETTYSVGGGERAKRVPELIITGGGG